MPKGCSCRISRIGIKGYFVRWVISSEKIPLRWPLKLKRCRCYEAGMPNASPVLLEAGG